MEILYGYCHCGCGETTRISAVNDARRGYVKGEPLRYVNGHVQRLPRRKRSVYDRLIARVDKRTDGCWIVGGLLNHRGYGVISVGGSPRLAHRVMYEQVVGPIPEGLTLDHSCHMPACVNPAHLEPVTFAENTSRQWRDGRANAGVRQREKSHCRHGHPYSAGNTYIKPSGERVCKTCRRVSWTKQNAKRRASRERAGSRALATST